MININTKGYEITKDGKVKKLSLTEYKIFLLLSGNELVNLEDIAQRVYNGESKYYSGAIMQRIASIRKKLGIHIQNYGRAGYKTEETIYIE